jgi:hypothetical protein
MRAGHFAESTRKHPRATTWVRRRFDMDRTNWPWSWEEEVEWKSDLEERDYDFLQQLIDNITEDRSSDAAYIPGSLEESAQDAAFEEYMVKA